MQSRNFTKVDFSHDALRFMILQQFVNTDEPGLASTVFSKKIDQMVQFLWSFQIVTWHAVFCIIWWFCRFPSLSDQNVRIRIKILRIFTVTQFYLKDRSEEKVPNSALNRVSTGGIFPFRVGILIFMHNIWCVNSIFVYNHHHVILNSHVLRVLKRDDWIQWRRCYAEAYVTWSWCIGPRWVKIIDFLLFLKILCNFVCILVFIQF